MTPAAGYSGTPLLKKLGVKDGQKALLIAVPGDVAPLAEFTGWRQVKRVKGAKTTSGGPYDYVHFFTADRDAYAAALPKLKSAIAQDGAIWVSWPKKASGVPSTVAEADIRDLALKAGLVDVKVCAVNEVWSGLKLVIPVKERRL